MSVHYMHDKREGVYQLVSPDLKTVKEHGFFVQDEKHGRWVINALKEGVTLMNYKHGQLHGTYQEWLVNGELRKEGTYFDGKRQGVWRTYSLGVKTRETTYVKGLKQGLHRKWKVSKKPELIECGYFWEDQKHGKWFTAHFHGVDKGPYIQGQKHGFWQFFWKNGNKYEAGRFEHGKRVGVWSRWNEHGELEWKGKPLY